MVGGWVGGWVVVEHFLITKNIEFTSPRKKIISFFWQITDSEIPTAYDYSYVILIFFQFFYALIYKEISGNVYNTTDREIYRDL